jgi:hypothetical protein
MPRNQPRVKATTIRAIASAAPFPGLGITQSVARPYTATSAVEFRRFVRS